MAFDSPIFNDNGENGNLLDQIHMKNHWVFKGENYESDQQKTFEQTKMISQIPDDEISEAIVGCHQVGNYETDMDGINNLRHSFDVEDTISMTPVVEYQRDQQTSSNEHLVESNGSMEANSEVSHQRGDVAIKSQLRAIRKYYHDCFKRSNKELFARRIKNVKVTELWEIIRDHCSQILGEPIDERDTYFYLGMLKLKQINRLVCDKGVKKEVHAYLACAKSYSKDKFAQVFKSPSFRKFCKGFLQKRPENEMFENLRSGLQTYGS